MNLKELYIMAVITFLTVFAWIVFGFFHAKNTSTVNNSVKMDIVPLTPTFDNDIINQLNKRQRL